MDYWRNGIYNFVIIISILPRILCDIQTPSINPGILTQSNSIGDCHACRIFIESFKKGLERTSRGKFEGGDTAWEEEKLKKTYKRSEVRLIDIQEGICKNEKYSVSCHNMAEKAEEFIEEWWLEDPDESADLFTYICIEKMLVCCPLHHFGKDCLPCPGDHENVCSGNGKCRGDGTRKGNGTCLCNPGYDGENCEECASGYYPEPESQKINCSKCHQSCLGDCRNGTPKDCIACKPGYTFDSDKGCLPINACETSNKCTKDQFCHSSIGSYTCIACDKSCNGCRGDGPDMCRKCARGYSKKEDFCVPDIAVEENSDQLTSTRYMTYVGLLIATVILLPRSLSIGGFIGAIVLTYILGAEYYLMINGHSGLFELKHYDLMQVFKT